MPISPSKPSPVEMAIAKLMQGGGQQVQSAGNGYYPEPPFAPEPDRPSREIFPPLPDNGGNRVIPPDQPPTYDDPYADRPQNGLDPSIPQGPILPGMPNPDTINNGGQYTPPREFGTFRKISSRGGPEYRPSNTPELVRRAAARRLGLE